MVIVLVPTRTPFSADRRWVDRRHLIAAKHSDAANDSTTESLRPSLPPIAPLLITALELVHAGAGPASMVQAQIPLA
jgi:hypothetical protein